MNTFKPHIVDDITEVEVPPTLPFPVQESRKTTGDDSRENEAAESDTLGEDALAAVESMSRRIKDLARELNCLGFFGGDDDGPKAA